MPILEEQVRDEKQGETEEEIKEEVEVEKAEQEEAALIQVFGGGLDHQTLMKYDVMAHHIAATLDHEKLAHAEQKVATQWDSLHQQYANDFAALKGLESIKGQVIAPVLEKKTAEARRDLEDRATALMSNSMDLEGKTREDLKTDFCGHISDEVTGAEYHPVAVDVFETLIAPIAKDPQPQVEQAQEQKQEEQAEEQLEEEQEKVVA